MNLLFNSFEGSDEEKWLGNRRKGYTVKCRETPFGVCKNPIGLSMYDGPMETFE